MGNCPGGSRPGAYCIKLLPEKNSGYFNRSFLPVVKSMVNSCFPEFSDFTRVFSPVKVLCNGPLVGVVHWGVVLEP